MPGAGNWWALLAVTVNFPAALQAIAGGESLVVRETVSTVGQLLQALERLAPGLGEQLNDPLYNFAVNNELLLHAVEQRAISDGDVVEVIPTMAGG